jgi:hypothetical protein
MRKLKSVLLWLWQLPQNLIGLLLVLITGARKYAVYTQGQWSNYYVVRRFASGWGVCLGEFIVFGYSPIALKSNQHELGHRKQSRVLGWLYLFIIGIPSATGNTIDQVFHKNWNRAKRVEWYYNLPWEKSADKLGGVLR